MSFPIINIPGDEWLYLRIYAGHKTADSLLSEVLYPAWLVMKEKGLSDKWFFIRYADPDFHLRYRIKLKRRSAAHTLISGINTGLQDMISSGHVWKVESGTYIRETERYGLDSMEYAEQLFYFDSEAFMKFMKSGLIRLDENLRWLFAMAAVNKLLDDFKLELQEKKELLLDLSRSFGREFGKDKDLAKQLSERYRARRVRISNLLSGGIQGSDDRILDFLKERSVHSHDAIRNILRLYEEGKMTVGKSDLLSSLIHMSMNRIFRNNNRMHEMVIYDFLFRHYKGKTYRIQ